mmetsp:Transcript_25935/g.31380  ORF Transcript_25935/g.31380 Transcript_25935/m.31380 type:complete len:572 (+) Transcript_25935:136-1851(+)|eukprot:CAMPEP_0172515368 /NCGR_PEP_ID=MMETSP1066-20121228/267501_1 /TAXON_ID=671091 /ORGANISM="Coscinodiscus wailesii, Strain CCMP2513" /LENGTH=571 /DNA_ID=CAMNT_0013296407 /DNA_START=123 /DNA_END=1838 /DNA_ORIENTATION=+
MKVQLSFFARQLPNVAGAFKGTSDPYAVVTQLSTENGKKPTVLGKTEVIKNTLNPSWTKAFILDFELGKPININVSVFDEVRKGDNKDMGSAMFEVGAVLGSKGNTMAKKTRKKGNIYARVTKVVGSGSLKLKLRGHKLENTEGFLRKSDPFYELCRKNDDRSWTNVYRSTQVNNNLSPKWSEVEVDLSLLCDGDVNRPIQIVVYDYEKSGKHVHMGTMETTVATLVEATGGLHIVRRNRNRGLIFVDKAEVIKDHRASLENAMAAATLNDTHQAYHTANASGPDFVDYISGGCELNLCVAIDFTGSNGDPRKPGTLHYLYPGGTAQNDYEKVILSLGTILSKYDADQKYPVWGFGAKYGGVVRHCFQCGHAPEVSGVNGVLNAYHETFRSGLVMSGPTVFEEVIKTAGGQAVAAQRDAQQRGGQIYTILLILSDGSVTDINRTIAALDAVSDAPLSVIIIGIGRADFRGMQFVDDHRSKGKRDIAQFVEFHRHGHSEQMFTEEALNEVPEQLVGYFTKNGIMPMPPVHREDDEIAVLPYNEDEEIDLSLGVDNDEFFVDSGGYTRGSWHE